MNLFNKALLACGALLFGAVSAFAVGVPFNQRTIIQFGQPVQVPGTVLPAGTYNFVVPSHMTDRQVVQIWNHSDTRLITTVMGIPDYSVRAPGKTVLLFAERPSNNPEALKAWFYPGFNTGVRFVYPAWQARQLARLNHTDVPAEAGNAHIVAITPSQKQEPLSRAFATAG
jgi:hypothetical protein